RGIYDSTTQYRESEKSQVFIRITKTKVLAAYGQIIDILFANKKFPLVVESTPVPEGIAEFAHMETPLDQMQPQDPYGFAGDGRELAPGALQAEDAKAFLGGLQGDYGQLPLAEGPAKMGEPQIEPAKIAAHRMEKTIHDQLLDTNAVNVLRSSIFESCLLGTGVVKGPFNFYKRLHRWERGDSGEREYMPEEKTVPRIEMVSAWDFHPDPAATSIEDCEYVIERHRMNRQQLRSLIKRPYFNAEAIQECLAKGPNYEDKYYEDTIREDETEPYYQGNRYEVLEYWGVIDSKMADEAGLDVADSMDEFDQVQVNIWICGTMVLRCVLNPFTPARIPYQVFPYEINPYQIWGVGIAENMEDAQMLMNGHVRMAIDNLALAGNLVFDVDEASLVPGQNMDIFPGKIFRRQSGVTGTAINGLKFPNTAPENIQMYQISRQLADEETGLPSIMHGQTGVAGTGRTASGLSMLLGGASLSLKTVIKNIDDSLLKPLGEAYFQWNMQFNDDAPDIEGDLEIKPRGVAAVMQKEVRSQRLTTLLQTVSNPMLAPFIKIPNLMRELAIAQDIDPDSLVNDVNEAQIFAEMLKGLANAQQEASQQGQPTGDQQGSVGQSGGVPPGANPDDASGVGGGTIGTGSVPAAGENNFTGTDQGAEG
ncbi:MAG: portal protein, partial [Acidimicrobiales bacterium]